MSDGPNMVPLHQLKSLLERVMRICDAATTSKVTKQKGIRAPAPKGGTSLDVGRRVLDIEARAVQALIQRLDAGSRRP